MWSHSNEIVFFDVAVDSDQGKVHEIFNCPQCGVELTKNSIKRSSEYYIDYATSERFVRAKQIPVLVNITLSDKKPGDQDTFVLERIEQLNINHWFPTERIDKDIDIWYERDYRSLGVYAIHHFFTKRNLTILAALWDKSNQLSDKKMRNRFKFALTGMQVNLSRMNRYRPNVSFPYNPLSGTLYIGSIPMESNVIEGIARKIERLKKASYPAKDELNITTTQSCSNLDQIPDDSIDYIFVDPPFGSNIIYSDLSIIWEAWLKVSTETRSETVVHRRKQNDAHGIEDYTRMMFESFQQYFRVLKPGRWMTIEFSNTRAAVWNAIQVTLEQSGVVVANVAALDKQMGSFKAVTTPTAVKQDLVISCYKPNRGLEARFRQAQGSEYGAWEFIHSHLHYLPVFLSKDGRAVEIVERTPRILYDRLVAYFIRHGYAVPLSAQEFQAGLLQRFPERDGMYFLSEQVAEYERKRLTVREIQQLAIFVSDEASSIQWVRQQLTNKPQTISDMTPEFMKELKSWAKHEKLPELRQILEESFLSYEGHGPIPAQIISWLRKSADMRDLIRSEIDAGRAMHDND